MEKEAEKILKRIYPKAENLTSTKYESCLKNNDLETLQTSTHYMICKFFAELDIENLEDNMSDAYIAIDEYLKQTKLPKKMDDYLDNVSKYVIERLHQQEIAFKESNQDLNFDKHVNVSNIEGEIALNPEDEHNLELNLVVNKALKTIRNIPNSRSK